MTEGAAGARDNQQPKTRCVHEAELHKLQEEGKCKQITEMHLKLGFQPAIKL